MHHIPGSSYSSSTVVMSSGPGGKPQVRCNLTLLKNLTSKFKDHKSGMRPLPMNGTEKNLFFRARKSL